MRIIRDSLAGTVLLGLVALAGPASAAASFSLDTYVGPGTAQPGPYGTVLLTQNGADVDVLVRLDEPSVRFVKFGSDDALYFDLAGFPAIAVSGLGSQFALETAKKPTKLLQSGGAGDFEYGIQCTSCGAGAVIAGPLSFTVRDVTVADFIQNDDGYFFASDVCIGLTRQGHCDAKGLVTAESDPPTGVPEPASIAMFGLGLMGLGGLATRTRRRKTA